MLLQTFASRLRSLAGARRPLFFLALVLLTIEFLDEWIYSTREASWPLIRADLQLSYSQIGLLLGLPGFIGNALELPLGILGDFWRRKSLILAGGLALFLAMLWIAMASTFHALLFAFVLASPASGSFVTLSQATLMDLDPTRHEQMMARWTLAGSLGVVVGPLMLAGALSAGVGWRTMFVLLALGAIALTLVASQQPIPNGEQYAEPVEPRAVLRESVAAMRRRDVARWLILLAFSDLMLDVLLGFLALYLVDVVGVSAALAGTGIAVWTGVGLVGDVLILFVLRRIRGLAYLRFSALTMLVLFPAFLLAPGYGFKLLLLGAIGITNAGWYSILKAQLYSALPGQSGTVMSVGALFGLFEALIPLSLGLVAERYGLPAAMWCLVLGPIVLLVGIPRERRLTR